MFRNRFGKAFHSWHSYFVGSRVRRQGSRVQALGCRAESLVRGSRLRWSPVEVQGLTRRVDGSGPLNLNPNRLTLHHRLSTLNSRPESTLDTRLSTLDSRLSTLGLYLDH
eukprot:501743-Rhodomonas_salina.1